MLTKCEQNKFKNLIYLFKSDFFDISRIFFVYMTFLYIYDF